MTHVVVVGDVLLDVDVHGRAGRLAPDAPVPVLDDLDERRRPGGAALAAQLVARHGVDVTLVCPLGDDPAARAVRELLDPRIEVVALPWSGTTPEKRRVIADGHPLLRLDTGHDGDVPVPQAIPTGDAVLVADYGHGAAAAVRDLVPTRRLVWDPHPRGPQPPAGATLVTPNAREAGCVSDVGAAAAAAQRLRTQWDVGGVAVTVGSTGAVFAGSHGTPLVVPAEPVVGDPCGAGDAFAAAAVVAIALGALPSEAVVAAVAAASAFVGRPAPAAPHAGGRVVATGGCFDLLHAGHVATLEAARRLGDALVVCVNDDASVARAKGPDRPVQPLADRVRVLQALACVDEVRVFGEDDPSALLREIRPAVWVKGGDYTGAVLPEAAVLAEWGGEAVTVPYTTGLSTTRLVERVRAR